MNTRVLSLWTMAWLAMANAQTFKGDGTAYNLDTPNHGNCNFMHFPKAAATNYVAVPPGHFAKTKGCGKCVQVRCTDPKCKGATASETLYVVDQCPGCAKDDLDFSREVFMKLTNGIEPGRLEMTWSFVDCPHASDIYMCKKDGSNPTWLAVQPADGITGVASLKINDKPTTMVDSAFYFKLESSPGVDLTKVKFDITPDNGGSDITVSLDMSKDGCVSTGKQFARQGGGSAPSPISPPSSATPTTTAPVATTTTPAPTTTTAEPTTVTPTPTTTTASTPEPTTSEVTTTTQAPQTTEALVESAADSLNNETATGSGSEASSSGATPAPSSSKAIEISVQSQQVEQGVDLGYYLLVAGGVVAVACAAAVIVRIRRKQWEEKQHDIDFDSAQSAIAARRSDDSIAIL